MFGRREEVTMAVVNFIDNYKRGLQFYIQWLFSANLRKEMSGNRKLKNIHKGKRCFIIGNGPSLKHYDLNKLTKEYVFTVNYMMKSDYFKTLNPNYHLFFDPIVFDLNPGKEDDKEKIELISSTLDSNAGMTYIIPYRRRLNFNKLFPNHKFIYIYNYKIYTPLLKNPSSLHRITPGFQNVVLYAINTALNMGFDEIYLLGVDMTGFLEHFEHNKVNDQWGHAYNKSPEQQQKDMLTINENNLDNEFSLKTYGKVFEQLKLMHKNALAKKVKLFNASRHGALDVIPRVDYEKIFADEAV